MKTLRIACVFAGFLFLALSMPAQTFTTIYSFCTQSGCPDGSGPWAGLVQATNGDFYGTTWGGGANGLGTVFKITPAGKLTTLYSFCAVLVNGYCTDGASPRWEPLLQATNGELYGTTSTGGAYGNGGTVFKITPAGKLTTLYSFCAVFVDGVCTDGQFPESGLIQATNGDFYGTTYEGGTGYCAGLLGCGTVFKITPAGKLTTYSFDGTNGDLPQGALVQAANGDLYGTTNGGGAGGEGTIFKITPSGTLTTLYTFCSLAGCTDGDDPYAGVIQAANGDFYGTTAFGGANNGGTVFKITQGGKLTTLYSFCAVVVDDVCTDGQFPDAGLIQATNGDFYGTTDAGGADVTDCVDDYNGCGTAFEITPAGKLTTLYRFCSQTDCTDGDDVRAGLVQDTNGEFYGTTFFGGADTMNGNAGGGTVFSLSVGLGPFVETQTTSGKVGATVKILGTDLTGTSSVTFNGTAATFTVVSASEITTAVPTGATTGTVEVTTPKGTLKSNLAFRVTPVISSFSPTSGPVGTSVVITGNSLTGATSVTFGGVKATSFTVNSYTQVTATVPTGAKTGKIGTTTPGGTAASTTSFTVN
jgi:uncharacterized repeat protein (TIGR03803 family)